jgi:hypothetical protein
VIDTDTGFGWWVGGLADLSSYAVGSTPLTPSGHGQTTGWPGPHFKVSLPPQKAAHSEAQIKSSIKSNQIKSKQNKGLDVMP